MEIVIRQGNIATIATEAIVNAANVWLCGGKGVDGAIHAAAGPRLLQACIALRGEEIPYHGTGWCEAPSTSNALAVRRLRCPVGEARITPGFNLPSKYVIHTVGPMWFDSPTCQQGACPIQVEIQEGDPRSLLASSIASCLTLAQENDIETIAFPAISCGVFGGQIETFATVAHEVIYNPEYYVRHPDWIGIRGIVFVLYLEREYEAFKLAWESLG